MTKTILLPAALLLFAGCGFADIVTVNIDNSPFSVHAGETVVVTGFIENNVASTVDLNNISLSLDGMFQTDGSPFLTGPLTIDPSGQTGDFSLFQFTVDTPYTDPLGIHTGTVTILGGVEGPNGYDPTTLDTLGSAEFQINVTSASAPEPSSAALFVTAMVLGFFLRRRGFVVRGLKGN